MTSAEPPSAGRPRGVGATAILVLDGEGGIISTSATAEALLGSGALATADDLVARLPDAEAALHGRSDAPTAVVELHQPTGSTPRWVELTVHTVTDGGSGRLRVVVARDVTAQREARRLREAFASVISHELRTPVTTIYGGAHLLADPSISDHTRHDASSAVAAEAERLYRLVEDLVVLAQYDQPLVSADEPILLQRFVGSLAEREAARGDATVDVDLQADLPAVLGRQGYVEHALRTFLVSAIRFSPRAIPILVGATPEDSVICLSVTDGGPAIDDADADAFFDLFHRSPRTMEDASGANISLHVCRRLVEAMGGTVWAAPRQGGLEVGMRLRIAADEEGDGAGGD